MMTSKEIKRAAWQSIDKKFGEIVDGLKAGDEIELVKFLDYCGGKPRDGR